MSQSSLLSCESKCEQNSSNDETKSVNLDQDENADYSDSDYDDHIFEKEEEAHKKQIDLQERFIKLQNTMNDLRCQLQKEKELWQKEIEEFKHHYQGYSNFDNSSEYIGSDDFYGSEASLDIYGNINSSKGFSILGYEQRLVRYQEALARAQAERRAALQRQIAISNYKRRLLEVENMCNLELLRVRQSVQFLQPLQMIVSEWNKDLPSGDGEHNSTLSTDKTEKPEEIKKINSSTEAAEAAGSRLYNEMNEMFSKISNSSFKRAGLSWQHDLERVGSSHSGIFLSDSSQNLSTEHSIIG